jgi:hypothetical protein
VNWKEKASTDRYPTMELLTYDKVRASSYSVWIDEMRKNILDKLDFVLGIEESWDSYIEVEVRFTQKKIINGFEYFIFEEKKSKKEYLLSPRYEGQQIEMVLIEKQIIVNISKDDQNDSFQNSPIHYATGGLQYIK